MTSWAPGELGNPFGGSKEREGREISEQDVMDFEQSLVCVIITVLNRWTPQTSLVCWSVNKMMRFLKM